MAPDPGIDDAGYSRFAGVDPSVDWALGSGRSYFFPTKDRTWMPILILLTGISPADFAAGTGFVAEQDKPWWKRTVIVSELYTGPDHPSAETAFCTALVQPDYFDYFATNDALRKLVRRFTLGLPLPAGSVRPMFDRRPDAGTRRRKDNGAEVAEPDERPVLVGIVDDGIAFGHARFRKRLTDGSEETRVEYLWVQDGESEGQTSPVSYGREIRKHSVAGKKGIDELIAACTREGYLDENELYLRAGLFDFRRPFHKAATWRAAHGTHVMDLACGFGFHEKGSESPVICVQLPAGATADTSGAGLDPPAVDAIQYILARAVAIAAGEPHHFDVVINLSYGLIAGPHDGTSDLELAIERITALHRHKYGVNVEVVLPAGNSHLSRCHAELTLQAGVPQRLNWRVLPDDKTPSILEVWLPHRNVAGPSRIELTIRAPNGEANTIDETHGAVARWRPGPHSYAEVRCVHVPAPTDRTRFRITVNPTKSLSRSAPVAPAGPWRVEFTNSMPNGSMIAQVWIQRDESLYGYPRSGRQSYLDDPAYKRFDHVGREIDQDDGMSAVKRARLINAMATSARTIVMGGFMRKEDSAAKYSAGGPTTAPRSTAIVNRLGPDAMTPSEDSRVHRGILGAGSRTGSVVAMGGTSVAAPQIARWIASRLARKLPGDRAAVQTLAAGDGRPNKPAEQRGGKGRIRRDPIVPVRRFET
jgi:hypothetical protein